MPQGPRRIPVDPNTPGFVEITQLRRPREPGMRPRGGERGGGTIGGGLGIIGRQAVPAAPPPLPSAPKPTPGIITATPGQPVTINLPGSSIKLPITRGISGRLQLLLPQLVFGRGTLVPSLRRLGDIKNPFELCMKSQNRAWCLLNVALQSAVLAASRIRVPFGTVTFFPGKFPVRTPVKPRPSTPAVPPIVPGTPAPSVLPPDILPSVVPTPTPGPLIPSPIPAPTVRPGPVLPDVLPGSTPPGVSPRPATLPLSVPSPLVDPSILPSTAPAPLSIPKPSLPSRTPATGIPGGSLLRDLAIGVGFLDLARSLTRQRVRAPVQSLVDLVGSTSPAVGTVSPVVSPIATPFTQPFAQRGRARTGERDCVEVKRKRTRNKCREGFYTELRGRTRYTPWRTVNCVTGETIKELS